MGDPKEKPEGIPIAFSGEFETPATVRVKVRYVGFEDGTVRVESVNFLSKHARSTLVDGEVDRLSTEARFRLKKSRVEFMRGRK